ncbi:MAG: methionyl-tRNA formyltransferase [Marinifilaceae bacterium]
MKVLVCCNSDVLAIPTLLKLKELGVLKGVCIPDRSRASLMPALDALNLDVELTCLSRRNWISTLKNLIQSKDVDCVWVLTFPWIFPQGLLESVSYGFVNFHFGLLPKYKGCDPIFWQIRNKEACGGITIHYMNEFIDEGPVILQESVRIIPGENYGLHCMRLGKHNAGLVERVMNILIAPQNKPLELEASNQVFSQKPSESDLKIDWMNQSAEEIECLVNASNPKYGGAKTRIAGFEMYVLEVTPVNLENKVEAKPGQIIHADSTYGLVVYCSDGESVRITVVRTREGYLSGVKLFNLGFNAGHVFDNPVVSPELLY